MCSILQRRVSVFGQPALSVFASRRRPSITKKCEWTQGTGSSCDMMCFVALLYDKGMVIYRRRPVRDGVTPYIAL
jgi:hypothetical protein